MAIPILQITDAGEAAIQALAGTDTVTITQMGLTDTAFVAAPTLTDLPGEFKRLDAVGGEEAAPNVTHLSAYDTSADVWTASGLGLYLDDGTLFAAYSSDTPLISKTALSFGLVACDIAFSADLSASISFGQPVFTVPPATTEMRGIVELATEEEAEAGVDDQRALTPATAKALIDAAIMAAFPVGFVAEWFGTVETIPAGWALCDGSEVDRSDGTGTITTPDMTGRVPLGAGGAVALGALLGATEKTVDSAAAGGHTPSGTLAAGQQTDNANTGQTLNQATKNDTAGGGSAVVIQSSALNDPGHHHTLGALPLELDAVAGHEHAVTIDVTQPSLALYFIMRI